MMQEKDEASVTDHYRQRVRELETLLDCRAGNLLKRGKHFVVVSWTEEYFNQVYAMIRASEKAHGTWTDEDEAVYQAKTYASDVYHGRRMY